MDLCRSTLYLKVFKIFIAIINNSTKNVKYNLENIFLNNIRPSLDIYEIVITQDRFVVTRPHIAISAFFNHVFWMYHMRTDLYDVR